MRFLLLTFSLLITSLGAAQAFCGFYVARADGALYNEASKVVFVRDGRKSVITMSSDYRGVAKDFAMIVPTPKVLKRDQIRTVNSKTIDHLDAYTAPRLVEYNDYDPCAPLSDPIIEEAVILDSKGTSVPQRRRGPKALGVTIKAQYAVGEYDIAILAAKQSDGLVTYLTQEGYKLPEGAEPVLRRYVKAGMKFFVARVNLKRHKAGDAQDLKPLQIAFRSGKFMLPLQLGKINAEEKQDVLLMALTRKGRVEAANYRNKRIPSNVNLPTFVRDVFGQFYKDTFEKAATRNTVMTEYAWDMAWCDPCAADPLSSNELKELGVSWLKGSENAGQDVFVTRMHFQYDKRSFNEDLGLKVTRDRENFQGRYVMNIPFTGNVSCEAGQSYVLDKRRELRKEAVTLQNLTDWNPREVEKRIRKSVPKSYW
jgi:hypothetical protein